RPWSLGPSRSVFVVVPLCIPTGSQVRAQRATDRPFSLTISGSVRDATGEALPGAIIEIRGLDVERVPDGAAADAKTINPTNSKGFYRYRLKARRIDGIVVTHPDWHGQLTGNLSHQDGNQLINIVLLFKDGPTSVRLISDQISMYESLFYLSTETEPRQTPSQVRDRYGAFIRSMPGPDSPPGTDANNIFGSLKKDQQTVVARKRLALFKLYGLPIPPELAAFDQTQTPQKEPTPTPECYPVIWEYPVYTFPVCPPA